MVPSPLGRAIRMLPIGASVLMAALALPSTATGQNSNAFTDGLVQFTLALNGTYGDERTEVTAALDAMTRALAAWDQVVATYEGRLAAGTAGAPPERMARLHAEMGAVYVQRGRPAEALREFEASAAANPRQVLAHAYRAVLLSAAGRTAEAAAAFRSAWEADRTNPALAYLVWQHRREGVEEDEAQQALDVLFSSYASLVRDTPLTVLPFIQVNLLDERALEAPLLPPAAYAEAYALAARGEYRAAVARFRDVAATDPLMQTGGPGWEPMQQGIASLRRGLLQQARAQFETAIAAAPDASEARRLLGVTYWVDFQYDRSIEQLQVALRSNPGDERLRITLGRVLAQAGRLEEAADFLQETIDMMPQSALAHWWLGSIDERLNRNGDALRVFEAPGAANVAAGRGLLHGTIARLHDSEGNFEESIAAYLRRVRATPNDLAAHAALARACLQQDRHDDAFAEYVAMLLIDPRVSDAHAGIGQIHLDAGRHEEALIALQRAVALEPGDTAARYALATALRRAGRIAEADTALQAFHRLQTQTIEERRRTMALDVIKEEAALRSAEGAHGLAAALWQRVVAQEPAVAAGYVRLAEALASEGDTEGAIAQLRKAAALDGGPDAYRRLATLYARLGRDEDSARARARYEEAQRNLFVPKGAAR